MTNQQNDSGTSIPLSKEAIERIEQHISKQTTESRIRQIESIVKSIEAIQSDVVLVVAFQQVSATNQIDLIKRVHEAVGKRVVDAIVRSQEKDAIDEYLKFDPVQRSIESLLHF